MPDRAIAPNNTIIRSINIREPVLLPLPNGGNCYICPQYKAGVVRFELFWPMGNLEQSMHFQAKAALQLSIAGTAKNSAEDILNEFETLGSDVHLEVSAMASSLILNVSSRHFNEALRLLIKSVNGAIFPQKEIDNFKQVESAELLRKMQSPSYWSKRLLCETIYEAGSPMAMFASPENLSLLSRDNVKRFSQTFFGLKQAHIILSGDVDEELAKNVISAINTPGNTQLIHTGYPFSSVKKYAGKLVSHNLPHTNQVSIMMGKLIPHQESASLHKLSLLNGLLGGFFGSRLMQEIREEKGLTYGIGSYLEPTPEGNRWIISSDINSANTQLALKEIKLILDSMSSNPPGGDELEKAKRFISGQIRSSFDGPFAWPVKIRQLIICNLPFSHYKNSLDIIWEISTAELCELADNFLHADSFCTAMAGQIKNEN